jgi:hypothetical protein
VLLHFYLRSKDYSLWEVVYFSTPASTFALTAMCLCFESDVYQHNNLLVNAEGLGFMVYVSGFRA